MSEKVKIHLSDIVNHLSNGVTRKISSNAYNAEAKSIEEIYNLTPTQVDRLFKHPELKGLRVKPIVDDPFELIIDDLGEDDHDVDFEEVNEESMEQSDESVQFPVDESITEEIIENKEALDVFS